MTFMSITVHAGTHVEKPTWWDIYRDAKNIVNNPDWSLNHPQRKDAERKMEEAKVKLGEMRMKNMVTVDVLFDYLSIWRDCNSEEFDGIDVVDDGFKRWEDLDLKCRNLKHMLLENLSPETPGKDRLRCL